MNTPLPAVLQNLKGRFTVVDLGAGNASGLPAALRPITTLVEIDAAQAPDSGRKDAYHRHVLLMSAVAESPGRRTFYRRRYASVSSLLKEKAEVVEDFGVAEWFDVEEAREVECATLPGLLKEHGIEQVDFLKTDLEGLDPAILRSAPGVLERTLVVQSELRFMPVYEDEPPFHETAAYLAGLGFELITLHPEVWKYNTANRANARDGRLVWADAVFFLSPERVRNRFGDQAREAFLKQMVLARLLGLYNPAEFLFEQTAARFDETTRSELRAFIALPARTRRLYRTVDFLARRLPGGYALVQRLERWMARLRIACRIYRGANHRHIGTLTGRL